MKYLLLLFLFSFLLPINIAFAFVDLGTNMQSTDNFIKSFSDDILLSTDDSLYPHHVEPTLAIDKNGILYSGWKNAYGHNTGGVRVAFSKSIDKGKTWSEPYYMPYFAGFLTGQSDPWLIAKNNRLYYAYLEYSLSATPLSQITLATSVDSGENWNLAAGTNGTYFADKETMIVDSQGRIYIVYDDVGTDLYVRLTESTDNGETFIEKNVIADSISKPVDHLGPYITTDNNDNLFVAWVWFSSAEWGDIFVVKSEDHGASFSAPIELNTHDENASFTISPGGYPSKATLPVIKVDQNDRVYVLWAELSEEDDSWGIFLRYSDDFGLTWSNRYRINQQISGDQWQPDFDIDSLGRLHISYYDLQGNYYRPYYRMAYFENEESTLLKITDAIPITDQETFVTFTRPGDYFTIRVDSKDIPHVVWTDGRDNEMDIYYSHGIKTKPVGLIVGLSIGGTVLIVGVIIMTVTLIKRKKLNPK